MWCDCCGYGSAVYKPLKGKCTMCKPGMVTEKNPVKQADSPRDGSRGRPKRHRREHLAPPSDILADL